MPVYSNEWEAHEKEKIIEITPRHMVDAQVSCTQNVRLLGLREFAGKDRWVQIWAASSGRFREVLEGFKKLRFVSEVPFGLRCAHSPRQLGEYNSGEKPPVVPQIEPSNLVLKMRQMTAAHHAYNRQPVLEPEDGPSFTRYEYEDDAEVLFEEEAFEKRKQEQLAKKKAAEAANRPVEAQPEPEGGEAPHTAQTPSGGPTGAPASSPPAPPSAENQ